MPTPANLGAFVQDKTAAIQLGKACFLDMRAGESGVSFAPNATLRPSDFPFHKFTDPNNTNSPVLSDRGDGAGSQGVLNQAFTGDTMTPNDVVETCPQAFAPVFHVETTDVRAVTGRNPPSVVNAVFNYRNFWDGRDQNEFNSVNPFGSRDPNAKVLKNVDGSLQPTAISIAPASLASQADGPILNPVEMSCAGRTWAALAHRLLSLAPLGKRYVDPIDSVLGKLAKSATTPGAKGLFTTYVALSDGGPASQLEANCSLYWAWRSTCTSRGWSLTTCPSTSFRAATGTR